MALATRILTSAAAALALAACSAENSAGTASGTAASDADCVPIADGTYQIRNGKILVSMAGDSAVSTAPETVATPDTSGGTQVPVGWAAQLEQSFAGRGYPWMGLQVRDGIAALTGTAPSMSARDIGFITGEAALKSDVEGAEKVSLIVNAIAVQDRDEGVGMGLTGLMSTSLSRQDCQDAFDRTMANGDIEFPVNTTMISPSSLRRLDAATGIARLCSAYRIEIAEHTDSRGSDDYNLQLSRQRANVVMQYMVDRGVDEAVLKAVGYGESQPLDPSNTPEARMKNERTEFRVSTR